jgi:hypothetical protein
MGAGAPVAARVRRSTDWVFPQQPLGLPSGSCIGDLTRPPQPLTRPPQLTGDLFLNFSDDDNDDADDADDADDDGPEPEP